MKQRDYINFLNAIEKLKCNTRHSWTSTGRQESIAEHSWRCAVMALLCVDEYPEVDINRVVKMCLIHDFGEAITGDIPAFLKTASDEETEGRAVESLLSLLPDAMHREFSELFVEMEKLETPEARLFKALDNMEALVSHNEAPISTWIPEEFSLNLIYGEENAAWSEWTRELKAELNRETREKINLTGNR